MALCAGVKGRLESQHVAVDLPATCELLNCCAAAATLCAKLVPGGTAGVQDPVNLSSISRTCVAMVTAAEENTVQKVAKQRSKHNLLPKTRAVSNSSDV